jgi:hypothetical protein
MTWRRRVSNPLYLGASEAFFRKTSPGVGRRWGLSALVPAHVEDVGSVSGRIPVVAAIWPSDADGWSRTTTARGGAVTAR